MSCQPTKTQKWLTCLDWTSERQATVQREKRLKVANVVKCRPVKPTALLQDLNRSHKYETGLPVNLNFNGHLSKFGV